MPDNNDHSGHRKRLRKKYLTSGFNGFSDQELLEMLLFTTIQRSNTTAAAGNLLKEYGTLDKVIHTDPSKLTEITGIGDSSAELLSIVGKIVDKLTAEKLMQVCCDQREIIHNFIIERFSRLPLRTASLILCDDNMNIIGARDCRMDSLLSGTLSVKSLLEDILFIDAYHIVLAFNHSDRMAVPEDHDYLIAMPIASQLRKMDVILEDIIVIGENHSLFSFRKRGAFSF